jgi:protein subunit release factor A
LQKKFAKIEEEIASISKRKEQIELDLAKPDIYTNHTEFAKKETEYKKVQEEKSKQTLSTKKCLKK